MKTLGFLLQKEFRQIFRNKSILRMIIAIPIIQLLVLPLAADYEIKNIRISIIDLDRSTESRHLIQKITASNYFQLTDNPNSFQAAFQQFERDEADIILEIPDDFEKSLVTGQPTPLYIAVNAVNGTKASVGNNYLMQIVADFSRHVKLMDAGEQSVQQVEVTASNWFNPFLNYPSFMVPGILVVLVTMVGAYMCALNIVKEKEVGTIEQINVTPVRKHHFILGKLIPFWIIGIVVFTLGLFCIARLIYGIVPVGSILLLYGFLSLYLVAVLGIGLIISAYSSTQQQAMSLAFFCIMIFMLMSGLFTSIDSMPEWAKWIAWCNPVTYFIDVTRLIILKGSNLSNLQSHFLIMTAMAVVSNTWAVLSYKKTS